MSTPENLLKVEESKQEVPADKSKVKKTIILLTLCGVLGVLAYGGYSSAVSSQVPRRLKISGPHEVILQQIRSIRGMGDTKQEIMLHTSAGNVFLDQGLLADAAVHYNAVLKRSDQTEERIGALNSLGKVRQLQGRLAESKDQYEVATDLSGRSGSSGVASLHGLANALRDLGNFKAAFKLYVEAWQEANSLGEDEADNVALLAADAGDAQARMGHLDEAFLWLERATKKLEESRKRLKSGGPGKNEALVWSLVGSAHAIRGDHTKAMQMYKKALNIQTKILRPNNPDLIATQLSIAHGYRDHGDLQTAREEMMKIEGALRNSPQQGLDLARCLVLKAEILRESKQYQLAQATMEEALAIHRRRFGEQKVPEMAVAMLHYGSILHDAGFYAQALQQYNEALSLNLATVGEIHPETAASHNSIGTLYEDHNELTTAHKHYMQCLEIQIATVGKKNPDVANTLNNIGTVLFRQGAYKEAEKMIRDALQVMKETGVPKNNPDVETYEENLAQVLQKI